MPHVSVDGSRGHFRMRHEFFHMLVKIMET